MSALGDKKQSVNGILVLAIVVLTAAVCVMGWALMRLYSSKANGASGRSVELAQDQGRQEALTGEVKLAIERALKLPVSMGSMKFTESGELKGQEVIRFTGLWRPSIDLFVQVPSQEPATLSPTDLKPEVVKWAQANPDKVKGFEGFTNPAAGFTLLSTVAATQLSLPVQGTIQISDNEPEPVVTFDKPILTQGKPAYTFGARALAIGTREYAMVMQAKDDVQAQLNQGMAMAYQVDLARSLGAQEKAQKINEMQAEMDKAIADLKKAHDAVMRTGKGSETKPGEDSKAAAKKAAEEAQAAKEAAEKAAESAKFAKMLAEKQAAAEKVRQAYMAPLLEATKPGKTWVGRWVIDRDGGPLGIKFLTQKPTGEFSGVLFDPSDPDSQKGFTGRIVPTPSMNDGWTLTLTSTEGSGINVNGPADVMGARAWLNRAGSSVLYFKLETPSTMIGRSGGRAAFKMEMDGGQ